MLSPARTADRVLVDVCRVTGMTRQDARYGRGRRAMTYTRWAWIWLTWQVLGEPGDRVIADACGRSIKEVRHVVANAPYSGAWPIVKAVLR